MNKYIAKAYVEKIENEEEGILQAAIASTDILDRHGDVVTADGWELENFKKNPVLLWAHNAHLGEGRPPIGKVLKIWRDDNRMIFTPQFDLKDQFAADIFRKYKEGFLNSFSVGFMSLEDEGNKLTKKELFEISAVPVPANPEANVLLRSKGMQTCDWEDFGKQEQDKVEKEENSLVLTKEEVQKLASSIVKLVQEIGRLRGELKKCGRGRRKDVDNMSPEEVKFLALSLNKATSKLLEVLKKR